MFEISEVDWIVFFVPFRATLKPVIQSIGGRPDSDTCKAALLRQAGYTTEEDEMKLDHLKMFVDSGCESYQLSMSLLARLYGSIVSPA